jgi:hypothetical protein
MSSGRRSALGAIMGQVKRRLDLEQLRLDERTQLRVAHSAATLTEYAERMQRGPTGQVIDPDGQEWPAVVAFYDAEEGVYWVADGHHRVSAAREAELSEFQADVRNGTLRDAVMYAANANTKHGIRLTTADKRRAIKAVLSYPEGWEMTDRKVAELCGSTHPTVAACRREVRPHEYADEIAPQPAARRDEDIDGLGGAVPPKIRKPAAAQQPAPIIKAEAGELSALPLESAPDQTSFEQLRALAGSGAAVVLARWSTREHLWALAQHGYAVLAGDGALLLPAPQDEQLSWFILQMQDLTRDGRLNGPRIVVLEEREPWLVWTRGDVSLGGDAASLDALCASLRGEHGRMVRLGSG